MKNIALIIAALLLNFNSYADGTGKATTRGSLAKASTCTGLGVCGATTTQGPNAPITMDWELTSDQTTLYMTITEENMMEVPEAIATGMSAGHFIMEEPFRFSTEIANLLGADGELIIPTGQSTVVHDARGYTVRFNLE